MDTQRAIADLAFLSDCRGGALVDRTGAVVWWCPERFVGDAWFARLLGRRGGVWRLTPRLVRSCERVYEEDSLILRTRFITQAGVVELREGLLFAPGARGHDIGKESPATLARSIRCTAGSVEISHTFEPRSAYGLATARYERDGLLVRAHGSAALLTLVGGDDLEDRDEGLGCEFVLEEGEQRDFVCGWGSARETFAPVDAAAGLEDTAIGWRSWSDLHERPEGLAADEISFAVLILQGSDVSGQRCDRRSARRLAARDRRWTGELGLSLRLVAGLEPSRECPQGGHVRRRGRAIPRVDGARRPRR